jgi:hypothetical protein
MKTLFLQEITEARLFRYEEGVQGRTAKQLGQLLYMALLGLEALRYIDERAAREYANNTLRYNDFDKMRPSTTDLANLIAVLDNQDDYRDRIDVDASVSPPVLQILRYLRNMTQRLETHAYDRSLLLNAESSLKISESDLRQIRRVVGDWSRTDKTQQNLAYRQLVRDFARNAPLFDLVYELKKHA